MSSLSDHEVLKSVLDNDFPTVEVNYLVKEFGGNIHLFFLKFKNEQDLTAKWRKLSNAIAVYFQSKLPDEFGKWNTYLFYMLDRAVLPDLKYKIENDTFSSRKIVVETSLTEDAIITQHVTNSDLILKAKADSNVAPAEFEKNEIIAAALDNKKISGKRSYTQDAKAALSLIEKTLKAKKNEI